MDGFKKRLNASIQLKLSFSLSLAILVVAMVAGVFSFASAFNEARELQDDVLRQIATMMDGHNLPSRLPGTARGGNDEESRIIVQRLGESGVASLGVDAGGALALPLALPDGLQARTVDGETFRVLVKTLVSGERIALAQETGFRDEIARESALRSVMPLLILMPILLLITGGLVRRMFRPMTALAAEIDQRVVQALHPMDEDPLPAEVRPFVVAINRQLPRVDDAMRAQRRFVVDAAHELRSPLTALSLQAERLAEAQMSEPARQRLTTLQGGIQRGRSLLDQLLALAKAQATDDQPRSAASVQDIYRRVLEDLMPLAEARRIDIGVDGEQDAWVCMSERDLFTVIRNLADNAIRYTPVGGRVDLSVVLKAGHAVLCILDNGPGIASAERERVFDPFYRTLGNDQIGSGLGLSIVKAIVERTDAAILLGYSDEAKGFGLSVRVRIPLADAGQPAAGEK